MNSREVQIACMIGLWYKGNEHNVYYHVDGDGDPIGYNIVLKSVVDDTPVTVSELEDMIEPFTVDNLTKWTIPFDCLPGAIQSVVCHIATLTYETILAENPTEAKKLNPDDKMVRFIVKTQEKRTLQ